MSELARLNLLCDEETYEGFDRQAGKTWIYPTNYPLRDYQFNIIQEALFKNTFVSLPTGLGKTFIAAVVMYNFYRWYPTGKIIFMAPTRPLVKQQVDACYNIMGIPKETTAELTGSNVQETRNDTWKDKRVFFVTAQVLSNDLDRIADLGPKIKCLVFDEAHRAKGNYAYCLVIKKLQQKTNNFRVLALSATPGNNIKDVEEVVQNLLISQMELRTDDSPDVVPYTFQKNMETVVVPIGEKLMEIRERYIQVLEKYTRVLLKHRVIHGNCSTLTKGKIFMTLKEFQEKNRSARCEAYNEILRNLNICITLYHAFELLIRHGLRGFLNFFKEHAEKPLLRGNMELLDLMRDVDEYLGPSPDISPLPDGTTPQIPENTRFGHPKFYKLCDILLAHFTKNHTISSRVIVFCEYRESVMEAYALLLQQKPVIRPKIFLGQGAITQRQQLNVIQSFVQGECNTLISTCIGEEGLDVGEVDLIVCFDISNKSPVRMIQRIGRTGRKRDGRVVIMVTEGREEQTLKACLVQKDYLAKTILGSTEVIAKLYKGNSRMVPNDVDPVCMKIHISVKKEVKVKNETIAGMFSKMENALTQGAAKKEVKDRMPDRTELWDKKNPLSLFQQDEDKICFSKYLEKQRKLQPIGIVCHSKESDLLVSLLQFADSRRYNIPVTQRTLLSQFTRTAKDKSKPPKSDGYKQSDLRSMLFRTSSKHNVTSDAQETAIKKNISDCLQSIARFSDSCKFCDKSFDCSQMKIKEETLKAAEWVVPDLSVLACINSESLNAFDQTLKSDCDDVEEEIQDVEFSRNNSIAFEAPKSFRDVLKKCDSTFFENVDFTQIESNFGVKSESEDYESLLRFFKLNALEDLFSSPVSLEETIIYTPEQDVEKLSPVLNKTLNHSVQESEDGSPVLCSYERTKYLKEKAQKKLFSGELDGSTAVTQINAKPRLLNLFQNKQNSFYVSKSRAESKSKFSESRNDELDDSISDIFDMTFCADAEQKTNSETWDKIDDVFDTSILSKLSGGKNAFQHSQKSKMPDVFDDISDICDVSVFEKKEAGVDNKILKKNEVLSDIEDICDISVLISGDKTNAEGGSNQKNKSDIDSLLDLDDICDLSVFKSNKVSQKSDKIKENILLSTERGCLAEIKNETKPENKSPDAKVQEIHKINSGIEHRILNTSTKTSSKTQNMKNKHEVGTETTKQGSKKSNLTMKSEIFNKPSKISLKTKHETTVQNEKHFPQLSQDSLADFEDSFITKSFKTPKKPKLNATKTRNVDSLLKKYGCENRATASKSPALNASVAPETQLSITQILNAINPDTQSSSENRDVNLKSSPAKRESDSENEFETHSVSRSSCKLRLKQAVSSKVNKLKTAKVNLNFESDDEFEAPPSPKIKSKKSRKLGTGLVEIKATKTKQRINPFIELEAEVLEEEGVVLSEDESVADDDCLESSFVNDETQLINNTQMHAHYLESVRSPRAARGFKIPELPKLDTNEVFSQPVADDAENTYLNDTFCVGSQELTQHDSAPCELEIAEMVLREERKRKRQMKNEKIKRKRILRISDDSD